MNIRGVCARSTSFPRSWHSPGALDSSFHHSPGPTLSTVDPSNRSRTGGKNENDVFLGGGGGGGAVVRSVQFGCRDGKAGDGRDACGQHARGVAERRTRAVDEPGWLK